MHLLRTEMKERIRAFDTIVDKNRQALATPKVVEVLGNYAAILTGVNDSLFMPNVRGTEIQLPKGRQADNNPALLPLLADDPQKRLRWTPLMFVPGRAQLEKTKQRVASGTGISEGRARQSVVNAMMFFSTDAAQASLDGHLGDVARARQKGLFPPSATLGNYVRMDDERDILYGRQMVAVPGELAHFSVPAVSSILAHEELHVDDGDKRSYESLADTDYGIWKELRGYHVGALVLGCLADDLLESDDPITQTTLYVESLRQRSKRETDEAAFAVNDAIAAYFGQSENAALYFNGD